MNRAEVARFERMVKIDPATGCWEWQGLLSSNGYGRHRIGPGRPLVAAHRVAFEHYKGPIPEGLQVDHLCRNRRCTNPEHLEAVTPSQNTTRQNHHARNRSECPVGHPYDEANTIITSEGYRRCRACERARKRRSDV